MDRIHSYAFRCCDLYLDPMTLIYKLDIDILKMYLLTKYRTFWIKAFKS